MDKAYVKLTVYFEEPFWVGVFERTEDGKQSAAKVTFGAEPKDYEVYDFLLKHFTSLRFSPAVAAAVKKDLKNPKKIRRQIQRQLSVKGIGTKSQQALKLQQEQNKQERKKQTKEKRLYDVKRRFEQKQQKKKERHKGK